MAMHTNVCNLTTKFFANSKKMEKLITNRIGIVAWWTGFIALIASLLLLIVILLNEPDAWFVFSFPIVLITIPMWILCFILTGFFWKRPQ